MKNFKNIHFNLWKQLFVHILISDLPKCRLLAKVADNADTN